KGGEGKGREGYAEKGKGLVGNVVNKRGDIRQFSEGNDDRAADEEVIPGGQPVRLLMRRGAKNVQDGSGRGKAQRADDFAVSNCFHGEMAQHLLQTAIIGPSLEWR